MLTGKKKEDADMCGEKSAEYSNLKKKLLIHFISNHKIKHSKSLILMLFCGQQ